MTNVRVSAVVRPGMGPGPLSPVRGALRENDSQGEGPGERIGRYTLDALIAVGGMASVYLGSMAGAADFSRVVAIKRMHPPFSQDPEFVARFRDEAWLCARLPHPSIVQTLDVVEWQRELLLIMEFVEGVTLHALRADATVSAAEFPVPVALGILVPVLHGLHAAHEATDDDGHPLHLVHRDFSPHNLLVSREGHAKVLDFGIAKARGQLHSTSTGQLSGKFGYLSPEQIQLTAVDRRADLFAAGIVLWETLTGERLFREPGLSDAGVLERVLHKQIRPPSEFNPAVSRGLDAITLMALTRDPAGRFESARAFALALEEAAAPASASRVAEYVARMSGARLARLAELHANVRRRPLAAPRSSLRPLPEAAEKTEKGPELSERTVTEIPRRNRKFSWRVAVLPGVLLGSITVVQVARSLAGTSTASSVNWVPSSGPAGSGSASSLRAPSSLSVASGPSVPYAPAGARDVLASPSVAGAGSGASRPVIHRAPPGVPSRSVDDGGRKSGKRAAPTAVSPDSCNPPTYVDSDGIRHFKKGCL